MEFGLFTEFPSPPGVSEAAAFDESLGQMKAAGDRGFDAVWLAEIHFQKDRSVLASPLVIAAALAACTWRVRIGIAVQVLPLSHPLRLAEDVATADHLSKGRLEFGVGRSRDPEHPYQSLDAGSVFASGQVLSVPGRLHHAQAVSEAASADPHRGDDSRHVPPWLDSSSAGARGGPH